MENRFLETDAILRRSARSGRRPSGLARAQSAPWVQSLSAADRRLVILIENGGIDLGIPAFVDALLRVTPGTSLLPESVRQSLVDFVREQIKKTTDSLIETAELSINRYSAAKPTSFGDVTILRDGTASYQDLKRTLTGFSSEGKVIDLLILTHGSSDYISVQGGVDGDKIRAMKAEYGKPLSIRSVYMMNCVGASLNQAWIDAGAKASSGSLRNNYLPEPTTFFFWKAWLAGQSFENAVTGAYRKTINLLNDGLRSFVAGLPFPGTSLLAKAIDVEKLDLVQGSAPVIQGQRGVSISSDALSFASTIASSMATTVLPVGLLRALQQSAAPAGSTGKLSPAGMDWLRQQEWPRGTPSAEDLRGLSTRIGAAERILQECVTTPLNAHQSDALISFICNVGVEAFRRSTLLRYLNQGDPAGAVSELCKWTKVRQGAAVVDAPALVSRRNAEAELFQRGGSPAAALASSLQASRYEPARPSAFAFGSPDAADADADVLDKGERAIQGGRLKFSWYPEHSTDGRARAFSFEDPDAEALLDHLINRWDGSPEARLEAPSAGSGLPLWVSAFRRRALAVRTQPVAAQFKPLTRLPEASAKEIRQAILARKLCDAIAPKSAAAQFREDLLSQADRTIGKVILPTASLIEIRHPTKPDKSGVIPKPMPGYTSCIDTALYEINLTKVEKGAVRPVLQGIGTLAVQSSPAFTRFLPGSTSRPRVGDFAIYAKEKNGHPSFQHIDILRRMDRPAADGTEVWYTVDGGQESSAVDKEAPTVEKMNTFDPATGSCGSLTLFGWVDVELLYDDAQARRKP